MNGINNYPCKFKYMDQPNEIDNFKLQEFVFKCDKIIYISKLY